MGIERLRPREEAVLRLAAHGLDNAAIAERLGISQRTVVGYWVVIYQVLGLAGQERKKWRAIERWKRRGKQGPGTGRP